MGGVATTREPVARMREGADTVAGIDGAPAGATVAGIDRAPESGQARDPIARIGFIHLNETDKSFPRHLCSPYSDLEIRSALKANTQQ
jgi:hypothetical protein